MITAAPVQDTNGGKDVTAQLAARHPTVTAGWADGGCKAGFLAHAADAGITFRVVPKEPGQKGFAPLPRRWAVERTFGWLVLHRRLARDYETLPERSATMIYWAMIPVDCTTLCCSVREPVMSGGCLTRLFKKASAVS